MDEDKLRYLMPSEVITDRLDQIIEAFVTYYGEDRRQEITNKLKNILILKFTSTEELELLIRKTHEDLFREIYKLSKYDSFYFNPNDLLNFLKGEGNTTYFSLGEAVKEIITGNKTITNSEFYKNYHNGAYPQLEEFFQTFKNTIIKSRSNNNRELIFEEIGKENFDALNDLVMEFYNTFGFGIPAMRMIKNYRDGIKDEKTSKFADMLRRKDEILVKMKEYSQNRTL